MIRLWKESLNKTGSTHTLPLIINEECCGRIRPITEDILTEETEIELLSNWRAESKEWFATQFDVTTKSTKEWLEKRILPDPHRILFIVETEDHQPIGQVGLCNINEKEKTCELDNILRGNRAQFPGWMYHACRTLLTWSFQVLNMKTVYLDVLADNKRAIGLYHKLGFEETGVVPLQKVDHLHTQRYLMKMRLRRGKIMQTNDAKEERYWQNWDQGDVAKRIDGFWTSSEETWRTAIVLDIKNCLGENPQITEIGCGTGLICQKLLQLGVVNKDSYRGGDISSNMLKLAKERLPEMEFNSWDIFNLNLEDKSQSNVICIQVLQHLPDYQDALKELVRVTKESLYISTWYNTTMDSDITFTNIPQDWEGQKFYNNNYSLPCFLTDLIAFSNSFGRVVQDIKVHNFHFYHNYSVFVSFNK